MMLQNAAHKLLTGQLDLSEDHEMQDSSLEPELNAYLNQMSPSHLINNIRLDAFKSSNIVHGNDGKLQRAAEETKGERPSSPLMI